MMFAFIGARIKQTLGGGGGLGERCKSWTSYPGQYSDLSEGATKTK